MRDNEGARRRCDMMRAKAAEVAVAAQRSVRIFSLRSLIV